MEMTNEERTLVESLSFQTGIGEEDIYNLVCLLDQMVEAGVNSGEEVQVVGLGKFRHKMTGEVLRCGTVQFVPDFDYDSGEYPKLA